MPPKPAPLLSPLVHLRYGSTLRDTHTVGYSFHNGQLVPRTRYTLTPGSKDSPPVHDDTHNPYFAANTDNPNEDSYVLTLLTDRTNHDYMTRLRKKYFPARHNKLDAHVALFRGLPGSQLERIVKDLTYVTAHYNPFHIYVSKPFRLGRYGIAIGMPHSLAEVLQGSLQERWQEFLSPQDNSKFRAHYTIQNMTGSPEQTLRDFLAVQEEFQPSRGLVRGLSLYRYHRGYWRPHKRFLFPTKL